jgi:hypothetical protein
MVDTFRRTPTGKPCQNRRTDRIRGNNPLHHLPIVRHNRLPMHCIHWGNALFPAVDGQNRARQAQFIVAETSGHSPTSPEQSPGKFRTEPALGHNSRLTVSKLLEVQLSHLRSAVEGNR